MTTLGSPSSLRLWLNAFVFTTAFYMLAYIGNVGALTNLPIVVILATLILTIHRSLGRAKGRVSRHIYAYAFGALALLAAFSVKQIGQSGGGGMVLAVKIALYHLVFLAGLLIGFYDQTIAKGRQGLYLAILFIAPLAFFVLVAAGAERSEAVSLFNRNAFAAYTLTASMLLLGFGFQRQPVSTRIYVGLIAFALIFNTTLGAALAFAIALMLYLLPQILQSRRMMMQALVVALAGLFAILGLAAFAEDLAAVQRLSFVYDTFANILRDYTGSFFDLDMATAVRFTPEGELDMSAIFRLLHWRDIYVTLAEGGSSAILFGGGTDWIEANKPNFTYNLAAHNEFIRLLVEQGLILGGAQIAAIFVAVWSVRRRVMFVPLFATALFLGTENLLNNFGATTMFFFILGHTVGAMRQGARAPRRRPITIIRGRTA